MLNILIVEDLPSDAGLCEREVKKALGPCKFLRVETREDFLKALTEFQPDLVLCDYKMPRFDGMTALKLAIRHDPDLPFILVTGSVSENVAVESIKAGAWDYVIKGHIKRLGPAALATLEEKRLRIEKRQSENKLRQSEERYRVLFENAGQSIAVVQGGKIKFGNPKLEQTTGYTVSELAGMDTFKLIHPDDREMVLNYTLSRQRGEPVPSQYQLRYFNKAGEIRWVERKITDITWEREKAALVLDTDITESKQAEEQIRILGSLIDAADAVILVHDPDGNFLYANKACFVHHGYSENEFYSLHLQQLTDFDGAELFAPRMKQIIEKGHAVFEVNHRRKDGTVFPLLVSAQSADWGGRKVILSISNDLTERKKAENDLHDSIERFNQVAAIADEFIWEVDEKGLYRYCSPAIEKISGYLADELVGNKYFYDLFAPEVRDELRRQALSAFDLRQSIRNFVNPVINTNGNKVYLETNGLPILDEKGNLLGYRGVDRDITERKQAEEKLQESEERHRSLIETTSDFVWEMNAKGVYTYCSPRAKELWGYNPEDQVGKSPFELMPPEDRSRAAEAFRTIAELGHSFSNLEFRAVDSSGRIVWIEISGVPFFDPGGKLLGYRGITRDMTERKKVEEQINKSKSLLQAVIDSTPDRIAVKDSQHRYLLVNKSLAGALNCQPQDMIGKLDSEFFSQEHLNGNPERGIRSIREDEATAFSGDVVRGVSRTGDEPGGSFIFDSYRVPLKDPSGSIYGVLVYNRDITELYTATENLKKSYEKVQTVLDETVEAIATICETRDPYTAGHQNRVSQLACAIALEMGINEEVISNIKTGAILHDVGKLYVPAEILSKPGKLTEIEFAIIRNHPQVGYDIVKKIDFPCTVAKVILQHHERLNGSGYPNGLTACDITIEAKIMAVADVVEAMSSHRPYRPALGIEKALDEINRNKGTLYDEKVVDICTGLFNVKQFKFDQI